VTVDAHVAAAGAQRQPVAPRHPQAHAHVERAEQAEQPAVGVHLEAHVVAGLLQGEAHAVGLAPARLGLDPHLVRVVGAHVHGAARGAHEERPARLDGERLFEPLTGFDRVRHGAVLGRNHHTKP
jgi:hypothetical protein